jgi:hypothetical protein
MGAGAGCLGVYWWDTNTYRGNPKGALGWEAGVAPRLAHVLWCGHVGLNPWVSEVCVPCWMLAAAAAVPTAWLWWRDSRRTPPGACPTCSYDLSGNTTGICPECGAPALRPEETSEGAS